MHYVRPGAGYTRETDGSGPLSLLDIFGQKKITEACSFHPELDPIVAITPNGEWAIYVHAFGPEFHEFHLISTKNPKESYKVPVKSLNASNWLIDSSGEQIAYKYPMPTFDSAIHLLHFDRTKKQFSTQDTIFGGHMPLSFDGDEIEYTTQHYIKKQQPKAPKIKTTLTISQADDLENRTIRSQADSWFLRKKKKDGFEVRVSHKGKIIHGYFPHGTCSATTNPQYSPFSLIDDMYQPQITPLLFSGKYMLCDVNLWHPEKNKRSFALLKLEANPEFTFAQALEAEGVGLPLIP